MLKKLLVSACLSLFLMAGCKPNQPTVVSTPTVNPSHAISKKLNHDLTPHLSRLFSRFDPLFPGRGTTDYPGHTINDIPKAYAMILLAELDRHKTPETAAWPDLGVTSGFWLINNADINKNGLIGWGVPIAWDAYGDGSENPANTEYTISTAIVIHALLDWCQYGAGCPKKEILSVVLESVRPYLDSSSLSPSGMFPYSLRESDKKYDTFNPAAYLAGQFQRLSLIVADAKLAKRLQDYADLTMSALLRTRKLSPETGAWYWTYSIQENAPNDLAHAAYIVEGIATYADHDGRLSEQFDMPKVFAHLSEFLAETPSTPIRGWPRFWSEVNRLARSYDVGMALGIACARPQLQELVHPLLVSVDDYLEERKYLRNPKSETEVNAISVREYETYLYRGLARCKRFSDPNQNGLRFQGRLAPSTPSKLISPLEFSGSGSGMRGVPNVELSTPGDRISTFFDVGTGVTELHMNGKFFIRFAKPGIPVWMMKDHATEGGYWSIFFRSIPDGRLILMRLSKQGIVEQAIEVDRVSDAEWMFRAAKWHKGKLYLVAYDNPTLGNYLMVFDLAIGDQYTIRQAARKLPSFQDPAGGTYEMIPSVHLVEGREALFLFAGNLSVQISDTSRNMTEQRLPNCLRVIEVAGGPSGVAALCLAKESKDPLRPYIMIDLSSNEAMVQNEAGVPWRLRYEDGEMVVDYASSRQELAAMLAFDLRRNQQSGWLEFGIDNTEGRIPWSQIYYLNGYLDLLLLADRDPSFGQGMASQLADIRARLDMEMQFIDRVWRSGAYSTRAFTVDRSKALFAVQTSRLLLLMDRYRKEVPGALELPGYASLRKSVMSLDGHIEVMAREGEKTSWLKLGKPHLRWPRGSKFYFDGVAVPFNHQNEWAYSILSTMTDRPEKNEGSLRQVRSDAEEMVNFFLERVSTAGELPRDGVWDYWWGTAYDGWSRGDAVSINRPEYTGDKIKAWISFRTIDAMASLSLSPSLSDEKRNRLVDSISSLVYHGKLYPFVSYELLRRGVVPEVRRDVAMQYARVSSPWELQSAAWSLYFLARNCSGATWDATPRSKAEGYCP